MSTLLFWTELDRLSLSGLLAKLQLEKFAGQVPPAESSAGGAAPLKWRPQPNGEGAQPNRGQPSDI